jgi:hypothetical protein
METFLGGINGAKVVRYPSRGYATSERYVKYLLGQINNVKTYEDRLWYFRIVGELLKNNKITSKQVDAIWNTFDKRVMQPVMRSKKKKAELNKSIKDWEKQNPYALGGEWGKSKKYKRYTK